MSSQEADAVKEQYDCFINNIVQKDKDIFRDFNAETNRFDVFMARFIEGNKKFESLWEFVLWSMTLFHGKYMKKDRIKLV